jgi:hypothetical protein
MSIQSAVEQSHQNRRRDPDGLATTNKVAWENLPSETLQKVFDRVSTVVQLIVKCH